ncbi:MgtC/SapB family protein [Zavarzinia sp.]|uniref:MgtC/SapB family protein n=1 Tax=Zavarzinia sp. TaxID=2027920 RepID=UPI0035631140
MDPNAVIGDLAIALGCGAVIGFERGWKQRSQAEGSRPAGIRTFSLIGLVGGMAGLGDTATGSPWPVAAAVLAVALLIGLGYWREAEAQGDLSLTTPIAGVLTVLLGAAATSGFALPAAMTAVVATVILSVKPFTHSLLTRIDATEMAAALRLLLISVVVLPVLPNQGYGPYHALNPFEIWLMVVAIAGLSFVGYLAMRLGNARRGILFAGIFGGLVSSTATTVAMARMTGREAGFAPLAAAGAVIAWVVMAARVLLVSYTLDAELGLRLAPAMGAMAVIGVVLALWFMRGAGTTAMTPEGLGNPFEIGSALRFALFLAGIMLASQWVQTEYGVEGLRGLAIISGLADVDAITLSTARSASGGTLDMLEAARVIVLAAVTNNLVKAGIGAFAGGRGVATRLIPTAVAMTAAAAAAVFL